MAFANTQEMNITELPGSVENTDVAIRLNPHLSKPARDLPVQVLWYLGQRLHANCINVGNWINLAEHLGFNRSHVEDFIVRGNTHKETAGYLMLLDWTKLERGRSLYVLLEALKMIGRQDCVRYLQDQIEEMLYMVLFVHVVDETSSAIPSYHLKVRTLCDSSVKESLENLMFGDYDDYDYELDISLMEKAKKLKGQEITLRKRKKFSMTSPQGPSPKMPCENWMRESGSDLSTPSTILSSSFPVCVTAADCHKEGDDQDCNEKNGKGHLKVTNRYKNVVDCTSKYENVTDLQEMEHGQRNLPNEFFRNIEIIGQDSIGSGHNRQNIPLASGDICRLGTLENSTNISETYQHPSLYDNDRLDKVHCMSAADTKQIRFITEECVQCGHTKTTQYKFQNENAVESTGEIHCFSCQCVKSSYAVVDEASHLVCPGQETKSYDQIKPISDDAITSTTSEELNSQDTHCVHHYDNCRIVQIFSKNTHEPLESEVQGDEASAAMCHEVSESISMSPKILNCNVSNKTESNEMCALRMGEHQNKVIEGATHHISSHGTFSHETSPHETVLFGMYPGVTSNGRTSLHATFPHGQFQYEISPDGTIPHGNIQHGTSPDGSFPHGISPHETFLHGTSHNRVPPYGPSKHGISLHGTSSQTSTHGTSAHIVSTHGMSEHELFQSRTSLPTTFQNGTFTNVLSPHGPSTQIISPHEISQHRTSSHETYPKGTYLHGTSSHGMSQIKSLLGKSPQVISPHGTSSRRASPPVISPHGTTPETVCPHGTSPERPSPHGTTPGTVSPHGTSPERPSPHGTTPETVSPHGTSPERVSPHGTTPGTVSPHGTSPERPSPHGTSPERVSPHGTTPKGVFSNGTSPHATLQHVSHIKETVKLEHFETSRTCFNTHLRESVCYLPQDICIADAHDMFQQCSYGSQHDCKDDKKTQPKQMSFQEVSDLLRNFPGWNPRIDENNVERTIKPLCQEDGHFIIWFMRSKRWLVLSISHMSKLIHYAIYSELNRDGKMEFRIFKDRFKDIRTMLRYYQTHGLYPQGNKGQGRALNQGSNQQQNLGKLANLLHVKMKYPLLFSRQPSKSV